MSDDLTDHEADLAAVDHNATITHELLDAWRRGDDAFHAVLTRCLSEFDLPIVIEMLVSMNHALIDGYSPASGLDLDQHLALLRETYQRTPPKETTTT